MECGKAGELAVPAKLSNEEERTVTGDSDSIMCGGNRSTDENSCLAGTAVKISSGRNYGDRVSSGCLCDSDGGGRQIY